MKKELSRRDFLKYTAAGAVTVAGLGVLSGCGQSGASATPTPAPTETQVSSVPTAAPAVESGGWLGTAPGITDDMCNAEKAMTADVVVVGAGIAGISAARAAAEEGASVIVIEQAAAITVRGLVFGCVDSRVHKAAGCTYDNMEIVNEVMKRCGNRPNARLWKMWAEESGAAYDWFEDALIEEGGDYGQFLEYWPNPPKYDNSTEYYKQYCTGVEFVDWIGAVTVQYNRSVDAGAVYLFSTPAVELVKKNGAVKGVYAQDADGDYIRVSANNGVILSTGDYGANEAMVKELCPEFLFATGGVTTIATSTGYGHRMAIWAGGMMEPGPHAHMCHTFPGFGVLGTTATLQLNA
ncbi:MAG: FAD-binding protein, partial [Clostridia bacterium]|nr:FAD-binding protein [Clostridia bacterium]